MNDWQFFIDVGGTFTDCIGWTPRGDFVSHKLLSSSTYKGRVHRYFDGSIEIDTPHSFAEGFFANFRVAILDPKTGSILAESVVTKTEAISANALRLHTDANLLLACQSETALFNGCHYELHSPEPAPLCGIRFLMGLTLAERIGPVQIRLGTTQATNALLERKGARTALITTVGFRDILAISYQNRPKLFELNIQKFRPLCEQVFEVSERLDARGRVLIPLSTDDALNKLKKIKQLDIDAVAICLLHAHKNSSHEIKIAEMARDLGFKEVSTSTEVVNLQRIIPRAETTTANAYLNPIISSYVKDMQQRAPEAHIRFMTSAGGLVDAAQFRGIDSILSGPAGGVVGVGRVAQRAELKKVIGFDMGGTSTDVCRFNETAELSHHIEIKDPNSGAHSRIQATMLAIETVAAGGGSICSFDGVRLRVGPESAGADPGPACYGRGGPLTITDCNLALGRLPPDSFSFPLLPEAARARLNEVRNQMLAFGEKELSLEKIAAGFCKIAASNMAMPIYKMSTQKGYDITNYAMVSFGGAGGQHCCDVADALNIKKILIPLQASILSAYGIGFADVKAQAAIDWSKQLSSCSTSELAEAFEGLETKLSSQLAQDTSLKGKTIHFHRSVDVRYQGQDTLITLPYHSADALKDEYAQSHHRTYGFHFPERNIELKNLRSEASITLLQEKLPPPPTVAPYKANPAAMISAYFGNKIQETPVFKCTLLTPGAMIEGPALILAQGTACVLQNGWQAKLVSSERLELERSPISQRVVNDATIDSTNPVTLTLFTNRFTTIAEHMGAMLQRTALSVNVKERLDFSCAVFGPEGDLIVNAPHIPVHLGAMGDTVRAIKNRFLDTMKDGDVYLSNDPYEGGSHLPDVTVVSPVFRNGTLLFFTANRAHHAEIGGITPGSMPPQSSCLDEEGVLLKNIKVVSEGVFLEKDIRSLLQEARYPTRSVEDNLADIQAQIAANEIGRQALVEVIDEYGIVAINSFMQKIRQGSSDLVAKSLAPYTRHEQHFCDKLDNGAKINLTIRKSTSPGKTLTFDFSGSSHVSKDNANANLSIVKAAVMYSVRCLVGKDIALNEGVLDPIELKVPSPSLLNPGPGSDPKHLPAVTAGNVETSQRIVDVTLAALGLAAASQGTMNNVLFGSKQRTANASGYYETICGGAGAGPGFDGCDAVQTHMTNTRITDPEVLEERFPVRLRRFEIRHGSGGAGQFEGGNGVIREIEFLDTLELSVIANRRLTAPFGLAGGSAGLPGKTLLKRHGSSSFALQPPNVQTTVSAGDILQIETPGGGGYGI